MMVEKSDDNANPSGHNDPFTDETHERDLANDYAHYGLKDGLYQYQRGWGPPDNPDTIHTRWCPTHRRNEVCPKGERLRCGPAWAELYRMEDEQEPSSMLTEIRDGIFELVKMFENEAPEIFIKPRQPERKYVERDARLDEPKQSRRRRVNL